MDIKIIPNPHLKLNKHLTEKKISKIGERCKSELRPNMLVSLYKLKQEVVVLKVI
jgi:hypothetical protein